MMDRTMLWQQFGAAIDMLGNAMAACPEQVWNDDSQEPKFWYVVYHALFWLDLYLSDSLEGFVPPAPFTLGELDPSGVMPERRYSKEELRRYLEHGREKCRAKIEGLTEEKAEQLWIGFDWKGMTVGERLLYNMRHVQHHAAQLNLMLRQRTGSAPEWEKRAKESRR